MTKARDLARVGSFAGLGGLGLRNRLINGNAMIQQRANKTFTTVTPDYVTDRMVMGCVGGTGINVVGQRGLFTGASSGWGHYLTGTMTNGTPYFCQRIEQMNVADLNGQYVTVSGLMFQDTGSTQQMSVRLHKPALADNFSSTITYLNTQTFNVPSGVITPFALVFQLGATDAATGLAVEVYATNPVTCTSKNFALADLQFEKGAIIAPVFDYRMIGTELALCHRYYYRLKAGSAYANAGTGRAYSTTNGQAVVALPAPMRAAPVGGYSALSDWNAAGSGSITAMSPAAQFSADFRQMTVDITNTFSNGQTVILNANNTTNAWIDWSAEL